MSEITLRKASAIQNQILEKIKEIELVTSIDLNEFDEIHAVLSTAKSNVWSSLTSIQELWAAYYDIRDKVATANVESGVSSKLASLSCLEKLVQLYKSVNNKGYIATSEVVLKGKLDKISKAVTGSDAYSYRRDEVNTGVFDSLDEIKFRIDSFSKQKQKLNDELLELNVTNKVTLSGETEASLNKFNIL